jgi:hypothetical protein
MKKSILLLCAFLAVTGVKAQSGAVFLQGEQGTQNRRVSPNGKWLVGTSNVQHPLYGKGWMSFKEDLETGERVWMTSDESDEALGIFYDVNDEGVVCGARRDPAYSITSEYSGKFPVSMAAVWDKDGNYKNLGLGTFSMSDFSAESDGSYATAISNDGKTVVGYINRGNSAWVTPCLWKLDDTTGEYVYKEFALPEGVNNARVNDVSGDGAKAVGYVHKGTEWFPAYWPNPDEYILLENTNPVAGIDAEGEAFVISNNGEYVGATINGREPVLYFTESKAVRHLGMYESYNYNNIEIGGITDTGDMVGVYSYGVTGQVRPFWYSNYGYALTDFDYYTYLYAYDIDIPYAFTPYAGESVSFSGMSADGKVIAGNDNFGAPWLLKSNPEYVSIPPTVEAFNLSATGLGEIVVSFERINMETYVWYKAKEYVIYRDGNEVGRISVSDLDAAGTRSVVFADKDVAVGTHYYSVAINYMNTQQGGGAVGVNRVSAADGEELLSPRSKDKSIYMESTFEFPLFDDFNTGSITTNGWSVMKDYGDTAMQFWGCGKYYGINGSNYLTVGVAQTQPYSYSLVSRHIDARDKESVYMSFTNYWCWVNQTDWPLEKDTLTLEISVDDIEWTPVKDFMMRDITPSHWSFNYIDLTPYAAGKTFTVRFRVHGQALAQYEWDFDNVRIDEKPEHAAPIGLMGVADEDGNYSLTWKNSIGAYQLSYLGNTMYNVEGRTLGNEGKSLIAVNKYAAGDLALYKGKYLTSVTTQLNKYESEDNTPIRAAIVIYEDGKLVREQEIASPEYNTNFTVKLDEPLLIDTDKELMYGVKLLEYGADQMPIVYHKTSSFVRGKSNIYSEDGGNTWLDLADFYEQLSGDPESSAYSEGYASWLIIGNVTDGADVQTVETDDNLYAWEVYKNGEKCSDLFIQFMQGGFTDEGSVKGDTYQVRTFYLDGTVSELSETLTNDGTSGITQAGTGRGEGYVIDGDTLLVNGDNERVALYDLSGMRMYDGSARSINLNRFGRGVYILKLYGSDGNIKTYKFMF